MHLKSLIDSELSRLLDFVFSWLITQVFSENKAFENTTQGRVVMFPEPHTTCFPFGSLPFASILSHWVQRLSVCTLLVNPNEVHSLTDRSDPSLFSITKSTGQQIVNVKSQHVRIRYNRAGGKTTIPLIETSTLANRTTMTSS